MVKTYILDTAFLRNEDIFVYFYNQLSLKGKTLVDSYKCLKDKILCLGKLVLEYIAGTPVNELMNKYGFKTKKSITDKVKKYYPDTYQDIIKQAHDNRRGYTYSLEKITSPFDAYLIGLMITDGYVLSDRDGLGLDMTDEDVIAFVAKTIGTNYKTYYTENYRPRYRVLITIPGITKQVARFGIVSNKSKIVPAPQLLAEEERFIPYIIRYFTKLNKKDKFLKYLNFIYIRGQNYVISNQQF